MANDVNREYGPHRRPMGEARSVFSSPATGRRQGAAVAGHARGAQRRFVDSAHRCSLARFARSLSALPNLSSTLSTVATLRAAHALAAETGRGFTRSREARSERSVHRCQLQFGEKGALVSALQNAGKAAKSWQLQTAM